jgi:heme-degrading monooxygenase HmoA
MFAVIFIVQPKKERWSEYLDLATYLKPKLESVDGFVDNERFGSKRTEGRLLSLSTWRDEKAVVRWRTEGEHHGVQTKGRFEIFEDYHLSVGEIIRDSHPPKGLTVKERRFDETVAGCGKVATIVEFTPRKPNDIAVNVDALPALLGFGTYLDVMVDVEVFESIYTPGKFVVLGLWRDAQIANGWAPGHPEATKELRYRHVRIIRDYGMFDRREAPQFFKDVPNTTRLVVE